MAFEQTWRWFGPNDPIKLSEVKQVGAAGIVNALHQVPVGEVWQVDEILKRKHMIESEGLKWSVVESLPVHENIKKRKDNYRQLIENYKISIRNLAQCGIDIICYNFMPVLDWSRTNLEVSFNNGTIASGFETIAFSAFDLFILKRQNAEESYTKKQINDAQKYYNSLNKTQIDKLTKTVLLGLPGSGEAFTIDELNKAISEYNEIGDAELRKNLYSFLKEIAPIAEESGVFMAIHPDDPPRPLLGLSRIVSNKNDIQHLLSAYDSPHNGLTLCTGSLGAGYDNDLMDITETFAKKVQFIHLRNVTRYANGDFLEDNHLDGHIDMYGVMKTLLLEQKKRIEEGRKNIRMPLRPDHGHLMLDDQNMRTFYPGYSLYGRMKGLAELRGLEMGIIRSLDLKF
ncbi:MAG: mannonate dehydratase [Ignavibacteriaceae bacterium]